MAEYTISKIKLPNGDICNIKDTWRGIQDNLTSSSNTTESLSAKQGYLLANGSARDSTKLPLAGGTLIGGLEIKGHIAGDSSTSTGHGLYSGGMYHNAYNNIILHGDASTGSSGIAFVSDKTATDGTITNINAPSDRAFIQYHAYGVTTATAEGTTPTLATSGEANKLVIGVGNDSNDEVIIQTPSGTGLLHLVGGTNAYVVPHTGNTTGSVGGTTTPVYVDGGQIKALSYTIAKSVPSDAKFTDTTYSAGTGISLSGTTFSNSGVTSIAGKTGAVTLADLGLSNAMHFVGTTTTVMSDGLATANVTINNATYTPKNGDVVLYSDSEYVWTGSAWERLGRDSSFKTTQTAKSDPQASATTSTTFIDTISQDANGVITATKKTLPSYVSTSAGVTAVTWDSTNKKLTRTINGSAADVVTIGTIKTALGLVKGDVGLGNVDNTADANKTVKYANMLTGMSSRNSTMTWGNQTGTVITCLASSSGGAWGFRDNNPASGQMSMTIDGTIYIKEGAQDISAAVKSFSVSGQTVTYTNLWGGTGTFTTQDTKNTAGSTNSTSKLFLIGATSQATNPTTNSYQYTYTSNGLLSALKLGLNLNGTEKAHLEWNNTDQSIDFIFE